MEAQHDSEAPTRPVPALFAQEKPKNRQAPQPGHVRKSSGGQSTRARRAVFQAEVSRSCCSLSAAACVILCETDRAATETTRWPSLTRARPSLALWAPGN